ncbi:MBL fold metallo-hydrolase [Sporolactobacillus laevolacticus]|uniref:MBL fold metallo-hydrolase n=1 Tax=Sporolactobacillus laevolacticus TaxID=33018 RepID=UPI0025B46AC9|nr:MBL fold metallo-hydrolase [Sporolactobacillus laevolacticus]MDN3956846.1 MBL fold metallo-hydrolase [Sporolactobacillus laevolacticus]
MKVKKISEHIWSLQTWVLIPITVWVVADQKGVTLVDAGISGMAKGILTFIDKLDCGPLQHIVLTHGHSDHVGAIKRILEHNPVPVYANAKEMPYMEGDLPYPRRKKAQASVVKGLANPLSEDEQGRFEKISGLTPYFAPGHSPGHVVYYHEEDKVLLSGDLFTSKNGKLQRPMAMFTGDMAEAVRSAAIVDRLKPARLEVCHGQSVFHPTDQLSDYLKTNQSKT